MEIKAKTKTEQILTVMKILAWVAFVGFLIEGGAVLFSYAISIVNPDAAKNLYHGLDFYNLREFNGWHYTLAVSFTIALSIMKAYVWYLVINILTKINLGNPFTMEVAQGLEKISYVLFGTWLVGLISGVHTAWLLKLTGVVYSSKVPGEFIFMAGLVFIISQIFKRGVEIQIENDLTV